MVWLGPILALVALAAAGVATFGFALFALYGIGGIKAATLLVDQRRALLIVTLMAALTAVSFLVLASPPYWALVCGWIAVVASVGVWAAFLPMVPERRFRGLVAPALQAADDVELDPDTRVMGFGLPDGPVAVPINVAAWHHIFELPGTETWHVGTY